MDTSSPRLDPIADSLDMGPLPSLVGEVVTIAESLTPETNGTDYEIARKNIIDLTAKGMKALDSLLDVADQSQSARAYEVAANMIGQLTMANEKLMDIAKKQKDLTANTELGHAKTINNNLFVGSTTELQKLIKQASIHGSTTDDVSR